MSSNAGNAKTGTLLQRHAFRELSDMLQRNHGVLGGSSERAVGLSAVAPDAPTDPLPRYAFADLVNSARAIAVRNDAWVRHPDAERILALLDIPGIHAREGDPNANLVWTRVWIVHFIDDQHISCSTLLLVPSGFHGFVLSDGRK